jgi:HD-GYP domain-containing protein (c-di-GMP phosphodiesterase class II)
METVLLPLARMVEARDSSTGNHGDRLAHMVPVFGQVLGLSQEQIEALRRVDVLCTMSASSPSRIRSF